LPADVGVTGGRIAAVGRLGGAPCGEVVDATGRYVAAGFVDAHNHADAAVLSTEVQLAALRQGVTTLVLGQDGLSYAPATPGTLAFVTRYFGAINGTHPGLGDGPVSVADLLATWRGSTAVNTAYLIPAGTLRHNALGGARRTADSGGLAAMRAAVEQGLAEGAVGLSTGLEYLPGRYADTAEIAELCRPVADAGLPYVTHMRGYGSTAGTGMAEAREIGALSGVAVHVSHLHGPGPALLSMVDEVRAAGIDLTFDTYPYLRGCTILAMAALPRWLDDADLDRAADTLADPEVRAKVLSGLNPDLWPRITLAHVPDPDWAWTEGRALPEVAAEVGRGPGEVLLDLLVATRLAASAVIGQPPSTDDASVRGLLRHRAHMGGSDAIYVGGHPHPRGWGAFARFLGRHVRELGDWTWEQAVVHLASHPARRFGLTDRGLVRAGLAADLVLIDPASVADRADYANPREPASGVDDVIVNGVPVLRNGWLTGRLTGRPLTPNPGR
jgi:N-acyl-D-amino-acid deacylase